MIAAANSLPDRIALWVGLILLLVLVAGEARRGLTAWMNRPLTPADEWCSRVDVELDELAARRACRPHGGCEVVYGPWPRRNDAA